ARPAPVDDHEGHREPDQHHETDHRDPPDEAENAPGLARSLAPPATAEPQAVDEAGFGKLRCGLLHHSDAPIVIVLAPPRPGAAPRRGGAWAGARRRLAP